MSRRFRLRVAARLRASWPSERRRPGAGWPGRAATGRRTRRADERRARATTRLSRHWTREKRKRPGRSRGARRRDSYGDRHSCLTLPSAGSALPLKPYAPSEESRRRSGTRVQRSTETSPDRDTTARGHRRMDPIDGARAEIGDRVPNRTANGRWSESRDRWGLGVRRKVCVVRGRRSESRISRS